MNADDVTSAEDSLRAELRSAVAALTATIQALTQAIQVLRTTSEQMILSMQPGGGPPPGAPTPMINTWEDDPFSEESPTTNPVTSSTVSADAPGAAASALSWQINEPRPVALQHAPGTAEFRFWNAEASLARAIEYWSSLMPQGTRWSTLGAELPVTLVAGEMLNANYSRFAGLRFYQQTIGGVPIFSSESPDIVRHELGHAVLDALRPELFDAASIEADAFHEAFGDMSSILAALQLPSFRQKVLVDTGGRLNVNSRLSRIGEQLGWGIRRLSRDAVDADCLRNAANRFPYRTPGSLPAEAPASVLSTEPHSFARIFTGAFLDALAAMVVVAGAANDANLETVSRDLGQVLVDGLLVAPVTPAYFSQVAAAMVQAAQVRNDGRYRSALLGAFVERGILGLEGARNLDAAQVPSFQVVGTRTAGVAAAAPTGGTAVAEPSSILLGFSDTSAEGLRSDASSAPGLPLQEVHAEFLDRPIKAHCPIDQQLFFVAPSAFGSASPVASSTDGARHYIATLLQLGRIDAGPATSMARGPTAQRGETRTHRLEQVGADLVLKRIQFLEV